MHRRRLLPVFDVNSFRSIERHNCLISASPEEVHERERIIKRLSTATARNQTGPTRNLVPFCPEQEEALPASSSETISLLLVRRQRINDGTVTDIRVDMSHPAGGRKRV